MLTSNITEFSWRCLGDTLGSDHYIIELQIPNRSRGIEILGTSRITDWKKFREETPDNPTQNLEWWTKDVLGLLKNHTREFPRTQDYPGVGTHLRRLWGVCQRLIQGGKNRKTDRKLKHRIPKLTKEAEEYANQIW